MAKQFVRIDRGRRGQRIDWSELCGRCKAPLGKHQMAVFDEARGTEDETWGLLCADDPEYAESPHEGMPQMVAREIPASVKPGQYVA